MTTNYGDALDFIEEITNVEAHTHGGGVDNDLTVRMDRLARVSNEQIEEIESFGFEQQDFHTGDPIEHDFTALIIFTETNNE